MSEGAVWSPRSSPNPLRKHRGPRPRHERVAFSLSRGTLGLGALGGVVLVGLAFFAGYGTGFRAHRAEREAEALAYDPVPTRSAAPGLPSPRDQPTNPGTAASVVAAAATEAATTEAAPTQGAATEALAQAPDPPARAPDPPARAPDPPARASDPAAPTPEVPELRWVVGSPSASLRGFGIQTGAYPTVEAARASLEPHRAALAHARVFVVPVEIRGRGLWHRVRIGVYPTRESAEAARRALPEALIQGALVVGYR